MRGDAKMFDNATMRGDAMMSDNARMFDNATMRGDAKMFDNATMRGDATMWGNAKAGENCRIIGRLEVDITDNQNLKESIYAQTLAWIYGESAIFYKKTSPYQKEFGGYPSLHDSTFIYKIGETAEAICPDMGTSSCSAGLHVSHLHYWGDGDVTLACEIKLEDVITCQEGKLRVKKLKVLGTVASPRDLAKVSWEVWD